MLGVLGGGWVGCFVRVGSIRGCLVVVLGVGRGGWAVFWWFFGAWWVFRGAPESCEAGFLPCRWVFSFTSFTGLYMYGCNGCVRVCARVCYLLAKVVKLVKLICGLTWENLSFTRGESCEAVVKLVKLPDVGVLELQAAVQSGAAVDLRGCVSTDQHPVHLQLGGERPTLDRFQSLFGAPDVVGLA